MLTLSDEDPLSGDRHHLSTSFDFKNPISTAPEKQILHYLAQWLSRPNRSFVKTVKSPISHLAVI